MTTHKSGDKVGPSVRSSVADKSLARSCAALHTHEPGTEQKASDELPIRNKAKAAGNIYSAAFLSHSVILLLL